MKFNISKEWCMAMAELEDGCEVGAGTLAMNTFEDSNMYQHAKRELELAGLLDKDSDYNGMIGNAVLELIKVFSSQGHSGFSAAQVISIFATLSNFGILNPDKFIPTVEDSRDTSIICGNTTGTNYQSNRLSSVFSDDGGKNWFDINNLDWKYVAPCRSKKKIKE